MSDLEAFPRPERTPEAAGEAEPQRRGPEGPFTAPPGSHSSDSPESPAPPGRGRAAGTNSAATEASRNRADAPRNNGAARAAGAGGDGAEDEAGGAARPARSGHRRGRRGRGGGGGAAATPALPDLGDDGAPLPPAITPEGTGFGAAPAPAVGEGRMPELPDPPQEGKPRSVEAAAKALVPRKPKIGDSMPAPVSPQEPEPETPTADADGGGERRRRRRGSRGRSTSNEGAGPAGGGRSRGGNQAKPIEQVINDEPIELDEKTLKRRRGRERKGRPVGRYLMAVHVGPKATQIAVLEGRNLVEHYVARPSDDVAQIHGNIYLGRVQNVLPGMEAAFVDIGTPKNAVLYRGDVQFDKEDVEERSQPRIEQVLRARQSIVCQVTKNPIAHKGARLTQEVSLPGRFVVLIPNSSTYGISKRLPDNERKRLRSLLDRVKPAQHGIIVRTAAEGVTEEEIERDVRRLVAQWDATDRLAKRATAPSLLYREPDLAVRVIREEFNTEYRSIIIDDVALFEEVRDYVRSISPELADRVEYYDPSAEPLPLFERHHVHEQLVRATDRKVWLPSGGSLIIEHTEALTVIDVNTGKNVGSRSLEETVFHNNLEAAEEIARQLRLRDIGGIIVIDFVDMESKENREKTIQLFREALARDKTRTQVFDISELGLVEMTRKRIGEGLLESVSLPCEVCERRGVVLDPDLVGEHMQ